MEENDIIRYLWLAIVAAFGGFIGFISKVSPTMEKRGVWRVLGKLGLSMLSSMFVAYISYEIFIVLLEKEGLAIALSGMAAYTGTDLLVIIQTKMIEVIKRSFDKI